MRKMYLPLQNIRERIHVFPVSVYRNAVLKWFLPCAVINKRRVEQFLPACEEDRGSDGPNTVYTYEEMKKPIKNKRQ
jgi:hypothetical protein